MNGSGQLPPRSLTGLEIASGVVLGVEDRDPENLEPDHRPEQREITPLGAFEAAVLPAVRQSPCVVSFSGGMDSSFVLAVATRVARREGLPNPIPVTWRFNNAPRAQESQSQDDVFRSLNLEDWDVLQAGDDLDLIGPVAGQLLKAYGVVHPANLHLHLPIISRASGGSMLTGVGGDQILAGFSQPTRTLNGWLRSQLPDWARVRRRRIRGNDPFPWLHRRASREVQRRHLSERRSQPVPLFERIDWHVRRRDLMMTTDHFRMIAADHGALTVHPFLDRGFHAALRGWEYPAGLAGRAELLARIGRGVLPTPTWTPRPKARFLEVFLRRMTQEFIQHWDGGGTDPQWVDEEALRRHWRQCPVAAGSATLIQQVWLNQQQT